jgi:hypothetical protein
MGDGPHTVATQAAFWSYLLARVLPAVDFMGLQPRKGDRLPCAVLSMATVTESRRATVAGVHRAAFGRTIIGGA